jgi:sigma54-dependent transcription regulator
MRLKRFSEQRRFLLQTFVFNMRGYNVEQKSFTPGGAEKFLLENKLAWLQWRAAEIISTGWSRNLRRISFSARMATMQLFFIIEKSKPIFIII